MSSVAYVVVLLLLALHLTNKLKDFHVKLLTQYNHDELNSDINKVAEIDEEFSEITQALNHRFN